MKPPLPADTHPDIERLLIQRYRTMSPAHKAAMVRDLNLAVYSMQLAETQRRHPDATLAECEMRVASRWLPRELMRRAFGWDPEEQGY